MEVPMKLPRTIGLAVAVPLVASTVAAPASISRAAAAGATANAVDADVSLVKPQAATNDVVVQVHASGFTSGELTWPSTWTDRLDRDRTPSIPGQELAGVVTALGT